MTRYHIDVRKSLVNFCASFKLKVFHAQQRNLGWIAAEAKKIVLER